MSRPISTRLTRHTLTLSAVTSLTLLCYSGFGLAGHYSGFMQPGQHGRAHMPEKRVVVAEDSSWEVSETTSLGYLKLESGASITAPDGYSVTLTVNGIEKDIEEDSSYQGNIVLTVTDNIEITFEELDPHYFRTGVYIEDGAYVASKSVAAAVRGGHVSDTEASNVSITSDGEKFNGIMVTNSDSDTDSYPYSIHRPVINFTGNGGNDFAGFGAAIMSSGYADVSVDHARISTNGAIRTAVFVGGNSTMSVDDSYIQVHNGTLPDDYEFTVEIGKMMEVPWMLGITGNVRATNLVESGTAYYTNSTIKTQAWGALSTDYTDSVHLYCQNSKVITEESGYGAYSIGDSLDYFSGCSLDVTDYGVIMAAEGSATFTDHSKVKSGRFGVMLHSSGSGTLTIEDGSEFHTKEAVIQAKGSFPTIFIDDAKVHSDDGILLQMMANDDPYFALLFGDSTGSGDTDSATVTTISNTELTGDLVNGNTANGSLVVNLENAKITGAITTATTTFQYVADGYEAADLTADDYAYIGEVQNVYEAQDDSNGVTVSVDGDSSWIVDNTSYLTELTLEDGAQLTAPAGYQLTMTVDGEATDIAAGSYSGAIVLSVDAL